MITLEEAMAQRRAYGKMVAACAVAQVKIEMHNRWMEWRKVTMQLDDLASDDYAVALYCEIVPGQRVFYEGTDSDSARVVRKLEQGGQCSLHVLTPLGRDGYLNFAGVTSPVVVLDVPISIPSDEGEVTS